MIKTIYGDFSWISYKGGWWLAPVDDAIRRPHSMARIFNGTVTIYVPNTVAHPTVTFVTQGDGKDMVLQWLLEHGVIDPIWLIAQEIK